MSDEELINDLKKVAQELGKDTVTTFQYTEFGKYSIDTISRRFGGWNNGLTKAGLDIKKRNNIGDVELLENIESLWIHLGRQPKYSELVKPLSKFGAGTYDKRFGTFRKGLETFIEYINSDKPEEDAEPHQNNAIIVIEKEIIKHKTKRSISARLKVQVLMRDGNKCKLCGITVTGENIHFDHIKPWSKGGETDLENLQVLCAEHNLAKGDLEYPEV